MNQFYIDTTVGVIIGAAGMLLVIILTSLIPFNRKSRNPKTLVGKRCIYWSDSEGYVISTITHYWVNGCDDYRYDWVVAKSNGIEKRGKRMEFYVKGIDKEYSQYMKTDTSPLSNSKKKVK